MPNHKSNRISKANALRWRHKKVERFERLLRREQKALRENAMRTQQLMAQFPSNSYTYFQAWMESLAKFEKNIQFLEAKIKAAGLCPVRVPYLMKQVVSTSVM